MKTRKTLFIILILLAFVAGALYFQSRSGRKLQRGVQSVPELPLPTTTNSSVSGESEFSDILATINRITIDTTIFQSSLYRLLRNNPVNLGTDTLGRTNPFAPVGGEEPATQSSVVTVQTIQPAKITRTTAEFGAQVFVAEGGSARIVFEYGTTDRFGLLTTPLLVTKSGAVLIPVTSLTPNTQYKVRAIAFVGTTTLTGNTMLFTTTSQTP